MKPLTIEELKALEVGDWVWTIHTYGEAKESAYARIIGTDIDGLVLPTDLMNLEYPDYGKTWLAYKNKEQAEAKGEIVELPCIREVFKKNKPTYRVFFLRDDNFIDSYAEWTEEEAERRLAELKGEKK